jgi:hypothetical protein
MSFVTAGGAFGAELDRNGRLIVTRADDTIIIHEQRLATQTNLWDAIDTDTDRWIVFHAYDGDYRYRIVGYDPCRPELLLAERER